MQEREHGNPFMAPYATPSQHSQGYSPYSDQPAALPAPQHPYGGGGAYGTDSQLGDAYRDDPVYPPAGASPNNSALLLPAGTSAENAALSRSYGASYVPGARGAAASRTKRRWIGLGVVAGIIVVAAAVVLPVYFLVIKKHNDAASASTSGGSGAGGSKGVVGAVTGGDGSTVVTPRTGRASCIITPLGAIRAGAWDAASPFGSGGRPNSWMPPLNESWDWAGDRIYGVNLGGWFVLGPCTSFSLILPRFLFPLHPLPARLSFLLPIRPFLIRPLLALLYPRSRSSPVSTLHSTHGPGRCVRNLVLSPFWCAPLMRGVWHRRLHSPIMRAALNSVFPRSAARMLAGLTSCAYAALDVRRVSAFDLHLCARVA
ncbi:hypothetical protein B0H17DRAFT_1339406 [Mycena rosella]|uniref:Uncharacterized protein n=1 Tax=Mycena rosella TaxID=1033263 RepID=A0AAD7C637_MYCRO|nr:hypothetical protein B0H17DRAFT_1339406 [Mycena rosella]